MNRKYKQLGNFPHFSKEDFAVMNRSPQFRGFVNCTHDFREQPELINGASELLESIFGEKGKYALCNLRTSSLPRNITTELEMIVRVRR